jgi:hypothetical protein
MNERHWELLVKLVIKTAGRKPYATIPILNLIKTDK